MQNYVLTFDSTHAAMAAQRALAACEHSVIPVPREISAGCGMALLFTAACDSDARALCSKVSGVSGVAALYCRESRTSYAKVPFGFEAPLQD